MVEIAATVCRMMFVFVVPVVSVLATVFSVTMRVVRDTDVIHLALHDHLRQHETRMVHRDNV